MKSDDAIRRQAIAVLSDGEDTASVVSFDDVLSLARQTGVNVYTVRLRSGDDARRQTLVGAPEFFSEADFSMKRLARETGALAFSPTLAQLRRVYSSIAQEVASQYSIGYEPSSAAPRGAFHRVSVRVVTRPELRRVPARAIRTTAGAAPRRQCDEARPAAAWPARASPCASRASSA